MMVPRSTRTAFLILISITSSVQAFSNHVPLGKGSRAYIANFHHNHRNVKEGHHRGARPTTRLHLNPANMMAKLSTDLVSSVESILESPDFNRLWLQLDDRTLLSIIIYSFVFLVGLFVATTTDDLNEEPPPPSLPPVAKRRAYTQVATNTKTQWNMENERIQKVQHMWRTRERLQTAHRNESITYHRTSPNDPRTNQHWNQPPSPSYSQPRPQPPPSYPVTPPPPSEVTQQASYPAPVNTLKHPMETSYKTPQQVSSLNDQETRPAPAPPISNAQYMASLGSASSFKQSYAVAGPNYTKGSTSRKSYKMTKWTPDQAVAPTNLYLANMSGPNRPALGSAVVQVPLYFSPGVISDVEQNLYYEVPNVEENVYYEDEQENDLYYDIPQGKGAGRSYAMTHWKPDMRVNHAGPGANAYLSNMNQPSLRYNQKVEPYATPTGLMTGFPSMVKQQASSETTIAQTNESISHGQDFVGDADAIFEQGGSASDVGTEFVESFSCKPPSPVPHPSSFVASGNDVIGIGSTTKSDRMTNWQPGLTKPTGSTMENSYLAAMNSQQGESASFPQHSKYDPVLVSSETVDETKGALSSNFPTITSSETTPPKYTPDPEQIAHPHDSSTITYEQIAKAPSKKSYTMTSWKPGSPIAPASYLRGSYLTNLNSAPAQSSSGSIFSPSTATAFQPSFQSAPPEYQTKAQFEELKSSFGSEKWASQSENSYLSSTNAQQYDSMPREAEKSSEPPAPTPYQPSFINYPNVGMPVREPGKSSKSIIGNPYFNGMGTAHGNAEAPGNEPKTNDNDWQQIGPPVWGVVESKTPMDNRPMQMHV